MDIVANAVTTMEIVDFLTLGAGPTSLSYIGLLLFPPTMTKQAVVAILVDPQ